MRAALLLSYVAPIDSVRNQSAIARSAGPMCWPPNSILMPTPHGVIYVANIGM